MAEPKLLFIQRDGALLENLAPPAQLAELQLRPGVLAALLSLQDGGFRPVLLGTPLQPLAAGVSDWLEGLLASQGIAAVVQLDEAASFEAMLAGFAARQRFDRDASLLIGGEALAGLAQTLGMGLERIDAADSWPLLARRLTGRARRAEVTRRTRETDIRVLVDLDAEGPQQIDTGIGFYDHMLEQIAKHGGFALTLSCRGDLHIDEHHTVEDCALALGSALDKALGERRGIGRYGFLLPMDETRAEIAIDLGGRPFAVFEGEFPRGEVGGLSTEMVPHFFRSLAETLRAAIHVRVQGENTHHMVEAAFKGVGRALRQALARTGTELPSTKGML
jgi:imidazoleglycerol-phosphate dehydratase/histidinol-phosphatase